MAKLNSNLKWKTTPREWWRLYAIKRVFESDRKCIEIVIKVNDFMTVDMVTSDAITRFLIDPRTLLLRLYCDRGVTEFWFKKKWNWISRHDYTKKVLAPGLIKYVQIQEVKAKHCVPNFNRFSKNSVYNVSLSLYNN